MASDVMSSIFGSFNVGKYFTLDFGMTVLSWVLGGTLMYLLYRHFYLKQNSIKYEAIIIYDAMSGHSGLKDSIIVKDADIKVGKGKRLHLFKAKEDIFIKLRRDMMLSVRGYGGFLSALSKPKLTVFLYRDADGIFHQMDVITKKPLYDKDKNVIGHVPILRPVLNKEAMRAFEETVLDHVRTFKHESDMPIQRQVMMIIMAGLIGAVIIWMVNKIG